MVGMVLYMHKIRYLYETKLIEFTVECVSKALKL